MPSAAKPMSAQMSPPANTSLNPSAPSGPTPPVGVTTPQNALPPTSSGPTPALATTVTSAPTPSGGNGKAGRSQSLATGTLLNGRYEIVRKVGGGGMGAVYLAKDMHLGGAPRAVKEMIESHLDDAQHEKAVADFRRESLLLTALEHPSIPTIYDYFFDEARDRFYLVMKYISGGDVANRLRHAPGGIIDEKTVAEWSWQVADVLAYLHGQPEPIIYRDLKPANLMVDGNSGRVMLIDFGIARWVTQKQEKGVTAVGTMGYAPPELFSGQVEPRSDVYSLGATMFHLLTGSDPQDNPLLVFDFSKNPRPRQLNSTISNEMELILMKAVEYKTAARFSSAAELRYVLATHLEKMRVGALSYGEVQSGYQGYDASKQATAFCGSCGSRVALADTFCAFCGARQNLAVMPPPVTTTGRLQPKRNTARLVVAGTKELESAFYLEKENSFVGRRDPNQNIFPDVDLSHFDPETKVSRRHARIWREGEVYLIEDLGSSNGTRINNNVQLKPRHSRVLESGDTLKLGETVLHFLIG